MPPVTFGADLIDIKCAQAITNDYSLITEILVEWNAAAKENSDYELKLT